MMSWRRLPLYVLGVTALTTPAFGQSEPDQDEAVLEQQQMQRQQQQEQQRQQDAARPGRVGESAVGRAGERQTRENVAPNFSPTDRIANRIENRVQSRIRNRIDQDYDPQANAESPFVDAEEKAHSRR